MRVSILSGTELDWAVTVIENPDALKYGLEDWKQRRKYGVKNGEFLFRWSSSWAQGGPIIQREGISINYENGQWIATRAEGAAVSEQWGTSPLDAAMRCYVAAMLGDDIEIPKEWQ